MGYTYKSERGPVWTIFALSYRWYTNFHFISHSLHVYSFVMFPLLLPALAVLPMVLASSEGLRLEARQSLEGAQAGLEKLKAQYRDTTLRNLGPNCRPEDLTVRREWCEFIAIVRRNRIADNSLGETHRQKSGRTIFEQPDAFITVLGSHCKPSPLVPGIDETTSLYRTYSSRQSTISLLGHWHSTHGTYGCMSKH